MMRAYHRCIQTAAVTFAVLIGGVLFTTAPALAAGNHKFAKSLEAPGGGFAKPLGLGVGPGGEVFVANDGSNVVDVYTPGATPEVVAEFTVEGATAIYQLAVDDSSTSPSKGDVYVANLGGSVEKYSYDAVTKVATKVASITEALTEPTAVAVDSSGNLYVANFPPGEGYVNKYSPTGTLTTKELITGLQHPEGLAVDDSASSSAKGDIYVAQETGVLQYNAAGACQNACAAFAGVAVHTNGVAVDSTGDVYVSPEASEISVYKPSGTLVEGLEVVRGNAYGIGFSGTTVYASSFATGEEEVAEYQSVGPQDLLTVTKEGTGESEGNVTSSPAGISCGATCSAEFPENEHVVLTEEPNGTTFESWSGGGCSGTATTCEVTMSTAQTVKATFTAVVHPKFPVAVTVTGEGEVTGATIACGPGGSGTCSEEAEETKTVTLSATPKPGWKFAKWSGVTCAGGSTVTPCKFTMPGSEAKVTAEFEETKAFPLTVTKYGQGEVVSTSPAGISCGATCTHEFEGTVTLEEKPAAGFEFAGWIGCKRIMETAQCEVGVIASTEVSAVFLKAGTEGPAGAAGPTGPSGSNGAPGAPGANGEEGSTGAIGERGANGATGATGKAGAAGPAGAQGLAGPAGPAGAAGKVELVQCKTVKVKGKSKQRCTTKTVSGTVKFTTAGAAAQATLSRRGVVYAAGIALSARGHMSLRLLPLRRLQAGGYTLTLISGAGRHESIRSESFTLR